MAPSTYNISRDALEYRGPDLSTETTEMAAVARPADLALQESSPVRKYNRRPDGRLFIGSGEDGDFASG